MFHKGKHDREKQLRFSIRKVSFGAASVAVAALFMFLGNGAVSAAEQGVPSTNGETQAPQPKDQNVQNGTYEGNTVATSPAATVETNTQPSTVENSPSTESAPQKVETLDKKELTEAEKEKVIEANDKLSDAEKAAAKDEAKKAIEVATASSEGNKPKNRSRRAAEPSSTTTDTTSDEAANQVYIAPQANAGLDELKEKLKQLPSVIQNNTKINNMDEVGAKTGVEAGEVREIKEFGGWKAVRQDDGSEGKFAIARKTEKGVFPAYTININRTNQIWFREQVLDGDSNYTLLLSKVVTKPSSTTDVPYDGKPYVANNESGNQTARTAKGFDGIEKIFKVYSPEKGSKVKVSFKVGYTGDVYGSKAKYKVEVFADDNTSPVYTAEFDPAVGVTTDEMTVVAAKDGTSKNEKIFVTSQSKEEIENKMALDENRPNGKVGSFTSKEIELSPGVTSYKVRISLANKRYGGMSYNSSYLQYSLPISGLNFNISQNTNVVAKDLLTKIYAKLKETVVEDEKGMTRDSIAAYDAELAKVKTLVETADLTTTDKYKELLDTTLQKRQELKTNKEALTNAANADATATKAKPAYYNAEEAKKAAYDKAVADAAPVLAKENAKPAEVEAAKKVIDDAKAALNGQPTNKEALTNAANADATATKAKPAYYNAEEAKKAAYDKAVADAAPVLAKENATQAEVDAAKKAVDDAKAALNGQPTNKEALTNAANADATATKAKPAYYNAEEAKKAAYDKAVADAAPVLAKENATQAEVDAAKKAVDDAKAALNGQPTNKEALTNAANADATATKATPAYYNAEEAKKAAYDKAVADAAPVLAKENAKPAEVEAAKKVIDDAKAALNGQPTN
ncbi:YSIRK-type signal peptide-containing protein, partial [Streptococcus mitis]|uniref:YSIRK-type signal peptide-containing protein n=1 Tax=Streptococcus mitis TaxID=28037 RepID=UPI0039C2FA23